MTETFGKNTAPWHVFRGSGVPHDGVDNGELPAPPPWRQFDGEPIERQLEGATLRTRFLVENDELDLINAALFLRRPLLVTGKPGVGKTSLAGAVAHELKLGKVLDWPINTRSKLQEGLYNYDAVGRLQDHNLPASTSLGKDPASIGRYIRLGPLGTALLPSKRPRVLLIDEIDKGDIDLPNDLLHAFEKGSFEIPELARLDLGGKPVSVFPNDSDDLVSIIGGQVQCHAFPFVVLTSNGERDFPPPFLRRCIRLEIQQPGKEKLARIVLAHFREPAEPGKPLTETDLEKAKLTEIEDSLITKFVSLREEKDLATDQLLNAMHLRAYGLDLNTEQLQDLRSALFRELQ